MTGDNIDFRSIVEPVARALLGEPNATLSTRSDLRFGSHGSLSVIVAGDARGTWFDHEASIGGGVLDLIQHKAGRANGSALDWLRENGFIEPQPEQERPASPRIVATYDYRDASGNLLFQVVRRAPKAFRQRRPDGSGGWIYNLQNVDRVPYRLPELLKADPTCSVLIVEGEKDVDRLIGERFIATCNSGGAGKWSDAYSEHLRDRDIVLIPDHDEAGERHIEQVAHSLRGVAESIRVLRLPGLPPKGDVSDWLDAAHSGDELDQLVAQAPPYDFEADAKEAPEPEAEDDAPSKEDTQPPEPAAWCDDDEWTESDLPQRAWVVPGYVLRGAVTLLSGPPSAMKSSLTLTWASALALGRDFGRFRPAAALPSLIYNVEDDMIEQRRRLSAVLRQFDATPRDIKGKVIRTGPTKVGTLFTRTERGAIVATPAMQFLEDKLRETGAAMLVVDPLAELHTADENDNTSVRAVIAEFRGLATRLNIGVVILHHFRKGTPTPGDLDANRGASAIVGAVRVGFTLVAMAEDDAKQFGLATDHKARSNYIRLDDAKANYSPIRDAEWFEKAVYDLDNGEVVPAPVPWSPPAAKVASLQDLAALAAAIERGSPTGEPWSPKLSGEERSVKALLEEHGFFGPDAQKTVMAKLTSEQSVVVAKFRSRRTRNAVQGLRIGVKPSAPWSDDE